MRESAVTSHIRLAAAQLNCPLWRNNCGGFYDNTGRFIRYGLGSEAKLASSDFIGIRPVLITPEMVGQVLGVFTAVEMKAENWHFNKNDKHLLQQKQFIDIVKEYGGLAGFATNVKDFYRIIRYADNK
jgi:hypothetical protein